MPPTEQTVDLIRAERVFDGFFKIDRYYLRHSLYEGGMSDEISREVFERGHAVAVLPYDPGRDTVVLIEQFRAGLYAADDPEPWLVEPVAGAMEADEEEEAVGRREAMEEAGLTLGRMECLGRHYSSPGGASERIALYVAECDSSKAFGIHGLDNEAEDIRVFTCPAKEAIAMVHDNRVRNFTLGLSLLLFAARRDDLRTAWA